MQTTWKRAGFRAGCRKEGEEAMKVIFVCFKCRVRMDRVELKDKIIHACPMCDREKVQKAS
ncbi:hypothetical protein HGB07_05745 [Candidatus Roizmanbacteria bacterium]|nr:hypothetical protein [Candidatus Roizmanbacteria bacterium]